MSKLAIIIPCYNEEFRLNFNEIDLLLNQANIDVYFANDGSKDNTVKKINQYIQNKPNTFLFDYKKNEGKAFTIYKSLDSLYEQNKYTYIGYLDADFSTKSVDFLSMYNYLQNSPKEFILASRIMLLNSNIKRKKYRHYIGRIILTIINIKYKLGIYDTQCGAKIFSQNILNEVLKTPFQTAWLFDAEVFIRLKKSNLLTNGVEFPITNWEDVAGSKLKLTDGFEILKEINTLYKNY
ncbi:glycosyltransferase [Empedobacter sp. GD03644]|uniref:glycosyltransferase n=1 Tax=Empedobacter sp. GD03644 TaxID=2975358 RepID=UPI00244A821E|nr:glycosyltransferase [Empedobacter sp. GD03644]MDH2207358.1 glycosyltransferase [Empedobacter sp. GD03644]